MIAPLRNLARRWASARLVSEADQLRRDLIRAQAAAARHEVTANGAMRCLLDANAKIRELTEEIGGCDRKRQLAERCFESTRAEMQLVRPVVEAAQAWRACWNDADIGTANGVEHDLIAAVDALPQVPTVHDGSPR